MLAETLARRGAPLALAALTIRCLAPAPETRPQCAADVWHALAEITATCVDAPTPRARFHSATEPPQAAATSGPATPWPTETGVVTGATEPRLLAVLPFVYREYS